MDRLNDRRKEQGLRSRTEGRVAAAFPLSSREDGGLDGPVQTAAVSAPKVLRLDGGFLIGTANEPQVKKHGTGMLDEFLRLADAGPDEFLRFGLKWGALHIAAEDRPRLEFAEPIQAWRNVALWMRAIHRIGAELSFKRMGDREDWATLGTRDDGDKNWPKKKQLQESRFGLMKAIRKLVEDASLRPRFYWKPDDKGGQWQIDLDSTSRQSNLLAVLTIQLMIRIADKEGFAVCSICHRSYVPRRQPAASKRNYCDDPKCRRERWKHLKREQRRRKQEGNETKRAETTKTRKR